MAITRAEILDATLDIARSDGLEAVSMRAVARKLEVTPMALYNHVGGKQELLDGLVERLLDELPVPDPRLPCQDRLRALGTSLRATAHRHPDAFLMLLRRPAPRLQEAPRARVRGAARRRRAGGHDSARRAPAEHVHARLRRLRGRGALRRARDRDARRRPRM